MTYEFEHYINIHIHTHKKNLLDQENYASDLPQMSYRLSLPITDFGMGPTELVDFSSLKIDALASE